MFNDPKNNPVIQRAISGKYTFSVKSVLKQSWEVTKADKLAVIIGFVFAMAVSIGVQYGIVMMFGGGAEDNQSMSGIGNLVATLVAAPFWAGLDMMALRRTRGGPIAVTDMFNFLKYFAPLALVQVIITFLVQVGLILLILPGIYIAVGTTFALMLMLEKGLSPMQSVIISIRAAHHQWFKVFLVFLAITPVLAVGALPMAVYMSGEGMDAVKGTLAFSLVLIWGLPMLYYAKGFMYQEIFKELEQEPENVPSDSTSDDQGSFSA
ncbi:hypothetical protein [Corallincola platygyrae]